MIQAAIAVVVDAAAAAFTLHTQVFWTLVSHLDQIEKNAGFRLRYVMLCRYVSVCIVV